MERLTLMCVVLFFAVTHFSTQAATVDVSGVTGAQVPEEKATELLVVNNQNPQASDENPGTEALPLKTIGKAVKIADAKNAKGIGIKMVVYPGTYRESINLPNRGRRQTDAPLIIEAKEKGKAVISGSDVWTGWERNKETDIYTHPWPYKWGLAPYPYNWASLFKLEDIVRRREMIFVDGKPLKQVLSHLELKAGTFYVDEEKGKVFIRVSEGTDIGKSKVETAVRSGLFKVNGRKNMVLRGFVFMHDTTPLDGGAVGFFSCSNILVEDCQFVWNNWGGFGFGVCEKVTYRRNVANYNGDVGMTGWKLKNVLCEDNETSYNNWRGAQGNYKGCSAAGMKNLCIHKAIYRNHRSVGNQTRGFWFDCDCEDIIIDHAFWCKNETDGIFFENDRGPILLKNSILAFNEKDGIRSTTAKNIILEDNIIYGNGKAQILLVGPNNRQDPNFETKAETTNTMENWTLKGNVIAGENKGQLLIDTQSWEQLLASLSLSKNLYYNPENARAFKVGALYVNFADWQKVTGGDLDSKIADPDFRNPQKYDFEPGENSPLKNKDRWQKVKIEVVPREFRKKIAGLGVKANWETPYPFVKDLKEKDFLVLDIAPYANRPLRGTDAWIGLGDDLALPAGLQSIHGVPFKVVDQEKNNGFAAILLKSNSEGGGLKYKNYPAQVEIPLGKKVKAVYFLHGCGFIPKLGKIDEYEFIYSDGASEKVEIIGDDPVPQQDIKANICDSAPFCGQIDTEDAMNVIVASPKGTLYIYTLQWINPRPGKTIAKIILKSDPEATFGALLIFGITAVAE